MSKFFRQDRMSTIGGSKVTRYLLYAIGEIVLVVIGIIIAVSINDKNKRNAEHQEVEKLLIAFEKDLKTNIGENTNSIQFSLIRDTLVDMVLDGKVTREMYQTHQVGFIILNYSNTNIYEDNLDRLLRKEDLMESAYDELLVKLKSYKEQISQEDIIAERVRDFVFEQVSFCTNELPWFSHYTDTVPQNALNYFMHDSIYRNKLQLYQILMVKNYMAAQAGRRNTEISILLALAEKSGQTVSEVRNELKQFGLTQLQPTDLESEIILEKNSKDHTIPLIYNASSDTAEVRISFYFHPNQHAWNMRLAPKSHFDQAPDFPHFIEIMDGETPIERYAPKAHSYLIIE